MSTQKQAKRRQESSVRKYNDFLRQLEIESIRIVSARVEALDYSYSPSSAEVKWRTASWYKEDEGGFSVFHRYNATIRDMETETDKAKISVTFCVVYSSRISITDDLFSVFRKLNLPLNTWPYFREYLHSATSRLGWAPFVAPLYSD